MKRRYQIIAVILAIMLMATCCLAGCGQKDDSQPPATSSPATQVIKDMAGREHELPVQIDKVFSTSPVGTIMVYTINPDKLLGWNYELREDEKKYIPEKYHNLPNLGGWYGKATCNTEEVLKLKPDIILSMGDINEMALSQADQIEKQLGIPVIQVDGSLDKLGEAYTFMGKLLGEETKAAELGTYCRQTVEDVQKKAGQVADNKRVRVYYAEGAKGLETDPRGSMHTGVLDMVKGENVAEVVTKGGMGMTPVSMEQLLSWNPDLIICWGKAQGGYYENIFTDPNWQSIKAVKEKKVYAIPTTPYNWFDRPPSVNRIIGLKWLGNLLYPDLYKYDMAKETREFYKKFYHYDLSDQEIASLLGSKR
jgi:iron complex transport system substrate-binding protein